MYLFLAVRVTGSNAEFTVSLPSSGLMKFMIKTEKTLEVLKAQIMREDEDIMALEFFELIDGKFMMAVFLIKSPLLMYEFFKPAFNYLINRKLFCCVFSCVQ